LVKGRRPSGAYSEPFQKALRLERAESKEKGIPIFVSANARNPPSAQLVGSESRVKTRRYGQGGPSPRKPDGLRITPGAGTTLP